MSASLRVRFTMAAVAIVGVVGLAAGAALTTIYARQERDELDRQLRRQAHALALSTGAVAPGGDLSVSFTTAERDDETWRFVTLAAAGDEAGTGASEVVELGRPLAPVERSIRVVRNLAAGVGLAAVAAAIGAGWISAGRLVQPLERLGDGARAITSTRGLHQRVVVDGPAEVRTLAETINTMLERLDCSVGETEAALASSQAFGASVAHELRTPLTSIRTNLDYLLAGVAWPDAEQRQAIAEVHAEQRRLLDLLDGIRLLALGENPLGLPRQRLDLGDLADERVAVARVTHPGDQIDLQLDDGRYELVGWPQGLAAVVDNLLANALTHARRDDRPVRVVVAVGADAAGLVLTVDDDGQGVAAEDRARVFARFARGAAAPASGSGLGLALVDQQARLHGGRALVTASPLGGARVVVHLRREADGRPDSPTTTPRSPTARRRG